jgi:putative heme-binding domain-containing protein
MFLVLALALAQEPAARGAVIFAQSCGIGYCHGRAGAASRGPRLAGRKFDREYLTKVITEGAGNGNMPAFAKQYSKEDIAAVVAYVLSLSGGSAAAVAEPARPAVAGKDEFAAGRALFQERCAACHAFRGKGGEVGPDLTAQAGRDPKEIRRDIAEPGARLSVEPVVIVTKAGEQIRGVKKQETPALLRVYDTSGLPPVLRTIYKDQIQSVAAGSESPMPRDFGTVLTEQQLAELVAFLRGGR